MRFTVLLLTTVALSIGCSGRLWPSNVEATTTMTAIDFTRYSDKGFLFTPNAYSGVYESRGLITAIVMPGATAPTVLSTRGIYSDEPIDPETVWKVEPLSMEDAFDEVYAECVGMGADALTQMNIEVHAELHGSGTRKPVRLYGYKITGFAIKRSGGDQ